MIDTVLLQIPIKLKDKIIRKGKWTTDKCILVGCNHATFDLRVGANPEDVRNDPQSGPPS